MPFINIRNGTFTINGHVVEGWADEDDALMFPTRTLAQVTRGADGKMQASSTGNLGGPVEIKLLATSKSHAFLAKQVAHLNQGGRVVFNAVWNDPVNGVKVSCNRGVMTDIMDHASLGAGTASTVPYTIEFEEIITDVTANKFTSAPRVTADAEA